MPVDLRQMSLDARGAHIHGAGDLAVAHALDDEIWVQRPVGVRGAAASGEHEAMAALSCVGAD